MEPQIVNFSKKRCHCRKKVRCFSPFVFLAICFCRMAKFPLGSLSTTSCSFSDPLKIWNLLISISQNHYNRVIIRRILTTKRGQNDCSLFSCYFSTNYRNFFTWNRNGYFICIYWKRKCRVITLLFLFLMRFSFLFYLTILPFSWK